MADMEAIVNLCKRRGFIFPSCSIYGGFANSYTYGPYGTELKNNLKQSWWNHFVRGRADILGMDGGIILHPRVWEASGHTAGFNDAMVDCKKCKTRYRADHLIEEATGEDLEGAEPAVMDEKISSAKIKCKKCGNADFTPVRRFNMMFKTEVGATGGGEAYLRPETAQAIFVAYKDVLNTMRIKLPFGIAQVGKAFRNEVTPGNFIFRVLEFEQMEIEYFIRENQWEQAFQDWQNNIWQWLLHLGIKEEHLRWFEHPKEKLAHYSKKTVDVEYQFPFGFKELLGLAYRTNFDLNNHAQCSGENLEYFDQESGEKFIPHVIEPSFGLDRALLMVLCDAYAEEEVNGETRTVLHLHPQLAPVQVAVLPLSKKEELMTVSQAIFKELQPHFRVEYDETQSIGKRYRRQDEIGTPYCVTVDFDSLTDQAVTVRHRDSMQQDRIPITELTAFLNSL